MFVHRGASPHALRGARRASTQARLLIAGHWLALALTAGCSVDLAGSKSPAAATTTDLDPAASDDTPYGLTPPDSGAPSPVNPADPDGTPQGEPGTPCTPMLNGSSCGCGLPDTADGDGDGTTDCQDGCPMDRDKSAPGACGCGAADTDSDDDGTADCVDSCPQDPGKDEPGLCGCGAADRDSDGDGLLDCEDGCPADDAKADPGVCGCGVPERDDDGDGILNCLEDCPGQAIKLTPGICGCDTPDVDSDDDGTPDCHDECPLDEDKLAQGLCGCGTSDRDRDDDGVPDCLDVCQRDPNKLLPGKCGCGKPDTDQDGDGSLDCDDECPADPAKVLEGVCGCGQPDSDRDGDGTEDCLDLCPDDADKASPGLCGCGADEPQNPSQPCPATPVCEQALDFVDLPDTGHGLCAGDCDDDSECAEGLRCFHTSAANTDTRVPGCVGVPDSSIDYCYDPVALGIVLTLTVLSDADDGLGECEGLCEEDEDCASGLICWENNSSSVLSVPGCLGTASDEERFCIDAARFACTDSP